MEKVISIEGMACMHCVNHVQQALSAVPGVKEAKVDLESKSATVSVDGSVTDAALKAAVDEAGYQAVSIRYCVDISNQLLATQSLLKSANQQIMRAHIEGCVREALQTDHIDPKLEEAFQLLERMAQS